MNFWETLWSIVVFFLFLSYLILLFQIVGDIFRDQTQKGWVKAAWIFFLLVLPLLTALVYLIVRGEGMAQRQVNAVQTAQHEAETYIREVARPLSPAEQIAAAKALLDEGTIDANEFVALKAKALA
ncbi:Phospholipase_D-nuclease N-terminal [Arthrobacter alpinus]|uniref:Phospholipase_D-nuclease N-terminal n=1 Tax=Arthrobacter alpinus TaxID=656366 RepID=A0A1H5PJ73_9MICC|nr:PLDc N-terminal domain-containing protein [Arthrobacter alpinus]SEF13111.1 Phospholipase_D-nuclease N-terminal [Arthrobacter alpinus]